MAATRSTPFAFSSLGAPITTTDRSLMTAARSN
jgi:hypothetical protein